ncbi:MAG: thioredoxin family protein [Gallionella sp.]|nr:thioredoxin family protein [Gallionella sp.]
MKIFAAGLLFILCMGTGIAEMRDAEKYFFDLKMGDFKSELATAKEEGKTGIMIMFELEDCPFCYRMKHTVLNQSEVQDYYHKHFLLFPVDIRGNLPMVDFKGNETTEKAFSIEHRVYGTPVFDFFDLDGKLITRFPGTSKDANEFLQLGKCVVEGACKTMSFTAYKKQQVK